MDSDSSDDDNGYCNCLSNIIGIPDRIGGTGMPFCA